MSMLRLLGIPATAIACAVVTVSPALATNRFAVVCVHNKTDVTINYQIKWADVGEWKSYSTQPGHSRSFSHRYDKANENRSPELLIRFDSDLRGKRRFDIEYKLDRRAAVGDKCEEGRQYHFRYEPNRRDLIDLVKG